MLLNDIPDYWSADQALAIYEFLDDLQHRIWNRYELQIFDLIRHDLSDVDNNQLDLFEFNDEIPF
jgi:hypothetical protein